MHNKNSHLVFDTASHSFLTKKTQTNLPLFLCPRGQPNESTFFVAKYRVYEYFRVVSSFVRSSAQVVSAFRKPTSQDRVAFLLILNFLPSYSRILTRHKGRHMDTRVHTLDVNETYYQMQRKKAAREEVGRCVSILVTIAVFCNSF